MNAKSLPGWVIDNDASVREEVAPYVGTTMLHRWNATRKCCRGAAAMLQFHANPSEAWNYRAPVPESTRRALVRLRAEFKRKSQ